MCNLCCGLASGVLLTYHWRPLDEATEPLTLMVVVPPWRIAQAHPAASEEIQGLIDQVVFESLPTFVSTMPGGRRACSAHRPPACRQFTTWEGA